MQSDSARSKKVVHPVVAFVLNLLLAVIGAAILDRVQAFTFFWHHVGWSFSKAFTVSVLVAGGLGFAVERFWSTASGKWIWTVTTALFFSVVLHYTVQSCNTSGENSLSCAWRHFSGANCIATLAYRDCQDALIFTSTFVRGIGYSIGAYLAELHLRRIRREQAELLA
jgi:hypothetical protein